LYKRQQSIKKFGAIVTVEKPKAIVIIVHGLCEHCGRYDYVVSKLNSPGYSVYRFDNRGHGKSEGERTYSNS
jgi:lysophospholipase